MAKAAAAEGDSIVLEVWGPEGLLRSAAVPKVLHGALINDGYFASGAAWSPGEVWTLLIRARARDLAFPLLVARRTCSRCPPIVLLVERPAPVVSASMTGQSGGRQEREGMGLVCLVAAKWTRVQTEGGGIQCQANAG